MTLIDVHSQHQNLLLSKEDFQLNVVDIMARDKAQVADYKASYDEYRAAIRQLDELREQISRNRDNEDFLRFQQKELSEDIKRVLHETDACLSGDEGGVVSQTRQIASQLHGIEDVFPEARSLAERLDNCFIEMKDISQDVAARMDDVEFDPALMDEVTSRLDTIYSLQTLTLCSLT